MFASCSADGTVAIWDVRKRTGSALSVKAHETDANVISWNGGVSYLLVSGADDGGFKIWDLRSFRAGSPVASFSWHKAPITSIEWCARVPLLGARARSPPPPRARSPADTCAARRAAAPPGTRTSTRRSPCRARTTS